MLASMAKIEMAQLLLISATIVVLLVSGWMMGAEVVWHYFDRSSIPAAPTRFNGRPAGLVVEAPRGNADGWSGRWSVLGCCC